MSQINLNPLFAKHLEQLLANTREALQANGFDCLAVHSGSLHTQFLDDMPYPFKVNPQFKRWVPLLEQHDCWILLSHSAKPTLLYFQPVDFWHKVHPLPQEAWVDEFDVVTIDSAEKALEHIPDKPSTAVIAEPHASKHLPEKAVLNPKALLAGLDFDRAIKSEYEIECMRRANRLGVRAHMAAAEAFRAGESEYGIHQAYCQAIGVREQQLPYNSIVALNTHASVLHYQVLETRAPKPMRSFLIDAGAGFNGYASDITRTWTTSDGEFHALIEAVDAMQQRLVAGVRADTLYVDLHRQAHREVAAVLRDFGLARASEEALVEQGVTRAFFPHGLGHLIGLQVHDVGGFYADRRGKVAPAPDDHPHLRLTRRLEPGFAITIEPGVYFIESLLGELAAGECGKLIDWAKVDALRPYGGVRIEDDVVVTGAAPENLTRDAFAAL